MKTPLRLICVGLVMLCTALLWLKPWREAPAAQGATASRNETLASQTRPVPAVRAVTARSARTADPVYAAPARPRSETRTLQAGLLEQLRQCRPEERAGLIAQFVAGHDTAGLQELLLQDALTGGGAGPALPEDVSQAILRRLAREETAWTADYLQTLPADTFRGELLGTVTAEWGRADLPAALAWAQQLGDTSLKQTALVHLSYRWFEEKPEEALAYAALDPAGNRQLLTTLVGQWSREQPAAAAAWAAEFSADSAIVNVAASAVASWATKDDLAAAEFVLGLPAGPLRHESAISVMSTLSRTDPATGALWATAFPSGPERDYAIENLVYNWATSDPSAALAWAYRLPAAERDTAIFAGAGGLIQSRPEQAAIWALSIQDESRRLQQAERAARRWLDVDRWAAEAWIRQSALPEERKRLLLASIGSGP